MFEQGTWRRVWRLSLLTALVTTAFWGIYWLVAGSVPQTTEVAITEKWLITLPFAISRWWDVAVAIIFANIFVLIFSTKTTRKDGLVFGLSIGLFFRLAAGLGFGLGFGLGVGLVLVPVFGLVFGLVFVLVFGLVVGLKFLFKNFKPLLSKAGHWLWSV